MNNFQKVFMLFSVSIVSVAAQAEVVPHEASGTTPSITLSGGKVLNAANVNSLSEQERQEAVRQIFKAGKPFVLYNFSTKKKEVIDDPVGLSKEKAKEYLPPIPEVESMFDIYAEQGPAYSALLNTYAEYQKTLSQ